MQHNAFDASVRHEQYVHVYACVMHDRNGRTLR